MKNHRIVCIFIATIILGASSAACAEEIEEGSIDVVINNNVYGSVSPSINLENTNIKLKAYEIIKGGESSYIVQDNITIPLSIVVNKEKCYINKMITGRIKLYAGLTDVRENQQFNAYVADGKLVRKEFNVPEDISIHVNYLISEEAFNNGEELLMRTLVRGRNFPGKADESTFLLSLDNILTDSFLFGLGKKIKEFIDIESKIDIGLHILTIKDIKLNVTYEYGGQQVQPDKYILDATVTKGEGSIIKSPNIYSFQDGTNVTLKAIANTGYYFDHWEGDITGSKNPVSIIMDGKKSVQAFFLRYPYAITANSFGMQRASFIFKNQLDTKISFDWNITLKGGLFGRVNTFSNGKFEDIGENHSVVITSGKILLFAFGPGVATINIDRPGEELITRQFGVKIIGPFILVS